MICFAFEANQSAEGTGWQVRGEAGSLGEGAASKKIHANSNYLREAIGQQEYTTNKGKFVSHSSISVAVHKLDKLHACLEGEHGGYFMYILGHSVR